MITIAPDALTLSWPLVLALLVLDLLLTLTWVWLRHRASRARDVVETGRHVALIGALANIHDALVGPQEGIRDVLVDQFNQDEQTAKDVAAIRNAVEKED